MANGKANCKPSIRAAKPGEAALLSDLALRSKSHWGYTAEFLEACRIDLTLSADYITASPVFVLEDEGGIAGFYGLREELGGVLELLYLFVEPSKINLGHGKRLWEHAVEVAATLGHRKIKVESDPYAEAFYRTMGARRVGETKSSVLKNRTLPLLEFSLPHSTVGK